MACKCQSSALFAKSEDYPDVHLCVKCKHVNIAGCVYNCTRFRSMVTGAHAIVYCDEARNDENLCGFNARFFEEGK